MKNIFLKLLWILFIMDFVTGKIIICEEMNVLDVKSGELERKKTSQSNLLPIHDKGQSLRWEERKKYLEKWKDGRWNVGENGWLENKYKLVRVCKISWSNPLGNWWSRNRKRRTHAVDCGILLMKVWLIFRKMSDASQLASEGCA